MNVACPRCASLDALRLPLIHREGLAEVPGRMAEPGGASFASLIGRSPASALARSHSRTVLARQVSPPHRRNVGGWLLVAIVFGVLLLISLPDPGLRALIYAGLAGLGGWMVKANREYNAIVLPALLIRWEQSFMCNRCGEIFVVL